LGVSSTFILGALEQENKGVREEILFFSFYLFNGQLL
jgi:hypothetical protein